MPAREPRLGSAVAAATIPHVEFAEVTSALGLAVALWAGVTAERARRWQRDRDRERDETRLSLSFEHWAEEVAVPIAVVGDREIPPPPMRYAVTLVVVNDGHSTESVSAMSIKEPKDPAVGDSISGFELRKPFANGDRELRPRERLTGTIGVNEVVGLDLARRFVGVVSLASGAEFSSPVEHFWSDIQETVDARNRQIG